MRCPNVFQQPDIFPDDEMERVPPTGQVNANFNNGKETLGLSFLNFMSFILFLNKLFESKKMPKELDIRSPGHPAFQPC